jgi:addiction module RelE/StbE family toxin
MKLAYRKSFKKQYQKLRQAEREKFKICQILFAENPFDPLLNNHELQGEYKGCHSINITGDLRAIYQPLGKDMAYFIAIGTHSQLYSL